MVKLRKYLDGYKVQYRRAQWTIEGSLGNPRDGFRYVLAAPLAGKPGVMMRLHGIAEEDLRIAHTPADASFAQIIRECRF